MSQETKMMNCEDYKKALTADPGFDDESGHLDTCAACREYSAEMLALNDNIAAAMALSVPELVMPELPDIETDNVVTLSQRRAISKPAWLAVAATVLIAAVVGIRMTGTGVEYGTLEEQLLAHVDNEAASLLPTRTPVSDSQLTRAVPENIAAMNHDAGLITYAMSCRINGNDVPHLVIQGEHGPITILLMPHEKVLEASSIDGVNVQGIILPVGDGSIAIIGGRDEQLDKVKQNVLDSVMWST
jgi:hypothetical protein